MINMILLHIRLSRGVEYLVEAAAAEAEAISAALAAAKARQNGEVELPDRDRGADATPSGKQISSSIKPDSAASNESVPAGVRLHHRAVSIMINKHLIFARVELLFGFFICYLKYAAGGCGCRD